MKSLLAVMGVAALASLAAWQFCLFVSFKDARGVADVQAGTGHLWLAIGIAFIVCMAGVFLFSKFLRYDTQNEIHITAEDPPLGVGQITRDVL